MPLSSGKYIMPSGSPAGGEQATQSSSYGDTEIAAMSTKLDGIEAGAEVNPTNAETKTAYEANADTNAFTDAEKTKLAAIEAAATADQTAAEIETAYNSQVGQVSAGEITAGTETDVRRFSPADIKGFVDTHGGGGGGTDDQTAAEVPVTDAGGYFAGAQVEAVLQEIGLALQSALASGDIDTLAELNAILGDATLADKAELTGVVNHGATASTARPSGYANVKWIGSVEPDNAVNGDEWIDTSA